MALTFKILQTGTLGSLVTLYPSAVMAGKDAVIKNIILTNTGTGTATVNLLVNKQAGSDFQITPLNLQLPVGNQLILDTELGLLLDTGPDQIRGSASGTGANVQYVITGIERDIS